MLAVKNSAYEQIVKTAELKKRIVDGCVECIENLNVDYIVVDTDFFKTELPYERLLSSGSYNLLAKS